MAKQKKNSSKKSDKEQLADGAKDIQEATAEVAEKKLELMPLNKSINEILQERVRVYPGNIGMEISDDTTIEENLALLDYTTQMSDHVGFMIGDVLNHGRAKWGQKYSAALNQTKRALSTLKGYAEAAARIPAAKRVAALTFSHHRELIRLEDDKALEKALEEVGALAEKGETPTTKEVRFKVQKLTPRKKKASKRSTSGKRGKSKKEPKTEVVYKPSDEEQAKLDAAEEALSAAVEAVKGAKIFPIVAKLTNKEKKEWVMLAEPIRTFYDAVDRVTGY